MAEGARGRREVILELADLRRRLAAAEDALTDALTAMKSAEGIRCRQRPFRRYRACTRCGPRTACPGQAGPDTARQAYDRASVTADRLARRVRELAERL